MNDLGRNMLRSNQQMIDVIPTNLCSGDTQSVDFCC